MKRALILLFGLMLILCLTACSGPFGKPAVVDNDLVFVTGDEGGMYTEFASFIARHAAGEAGLRIACEPSSGSQTNIFKLGEDNADLAFCQSDVMAYAYTGSGLFADLGATDCFSVVAALYTEQVQIVTLDPNIRTVADLAGKKVSIGADGSGVYFNALDVLAAYGLSEDDIVPSYHSFNKSADALKNGDIDAAFIVAGAPTAAVADLTETDKVYLLSLDDEHIDKLLAASPYYVRCTVPEGIYGMEQELVTVGVSAVILARDNVSENAVYALTRDIFDNAAELEADFYKYHEVNAAYGASITSVPYHPGAARYFAEQGFDVPVK